MVFLFVLVVCRFSGCSYGYRLTVRGTIIDAQTNEPIADAPVGLRTITEGQITAVVLAVDRAGLPLGIPTDVNGAFTLSMYAYNSTIPKPDRLQLIINRDGCEKRFIIDVNDHNAQFLQDETYGKVLDLIDPILVPPCGPSP